MTGWALTLDDERPVRLELFVNGVLAAATTAHATRDDVARSDPRFKAACGFSFQWPPEQAPRPGDRLEVRIAGTGIHLVNSPYTVG